MASTFKLESGVQLLTRLTKKSEIENFYPNLFPFGPKYGFMVEIFSDTDMSALISDMICEAMIPQKYSGAGTGVLLFKTDGKLIYESLMNHLKQKLTLRLSSANDCHTETVNTVFNDILSNFFTLEIYDASQLYTTIHSLDNILMEHSNISIVIFDTLTAFYWSEQGFKLTKMDLYIKNLIRIIKNVTKEHKVLSIYTRPEYFCSNKEANIFEKCEHPIANGLNYRIQLLNKIEKVGYQVNIKTQETFYKKYFNIINKEICWQ